jgi:hypothetical protein
MFGDEEALKAAHRGVGIAVVCRATRKDRWTVRVLLAHPTTSTLAHDRYEFRVTAATEDEAKEAGFQFARQKIDHLLGAPGR